MNGTLQDIINKFHEPKILVIGDFILDSYLKGDTTRLSPEAPVPVVDVLEEQKFLGGAANTAANIASLGAKVMFCSVLGKDETANEALGLLKKMNIGSPGIIQDTERKTIKKERIVAKSRVLLRCDRGTESPISNNTEKKLAKTLRNVFPICDAVIIADYHKGVLTDYIIDVIEGLQKENPKLIAIDSKRLSAFKRIKPSLVKPNYEEAIKLLSLPHLSSGRCNQLKSMGESLYKKTGSTFTAVTLDAEGAIIFEEGQLVYHCHAHPVNFPNVNGAGDTFLSAFTLAMSCGATISSATELASAASAIAIGKEATAHCRREELYGFFGLGNKYVQDIDELALICERYRKEERHIVFTNGCFDILHSGHVNYLHRAKELGHILIVAVNNDESIRRIKGKERPINPLSDRIEVLSALSAIDHLISFGKKTDDTPIPLIKKIKPDLYVKGGDYSIENLPEASVVEKFGGEVQILPHLENHSTTHIIQRIHKSSRRSPLSV